MEILAVGGFAVIIGSSVAVMHSLLLRSGDNLRLPQLLKYIGLAGCGCALVSVLG